MNKALRKIRRIIGITILSLFVVSFLHCELGFLGGNDYNHSFHNHCTIVKGSTTPSDKMNNNDLTKLNTVIVFIPKISDEEDPISLTFFSKIENSLHSNRTNKIYLDNNTFLI